MPRSIELVFSYYKRNVELQFEEVVLSLVGICVLAISKGSARHKSAAFSSRTHVEHSEMNVCPRMIEMHCVRLGMDTQAATLIHIFNCYFLLDNALIPIFLNYRATSEFIVAIAVQAVPCRSFIVGGSLLAVRCWPFVAVDRRIRRPLVIPPPFFARCVGHPRCPLGVVVGDRNWLVNQCSN